MSRDRFRTVVTALITFEGRILIGRKEKRKGHPISGKWHVLGGHLDHGEDIEEAVKREVKEETGLEVSVKDLVDVMTFSWRKDEARDCIRFVYHVEAESDNARPRDDLVDVKWVSPERLKDELDTEDAERLEKRESQEKFLERLKNE